MGAADSMLPEPVQPPPAAAAGEPLGTAAPTAGPMAVAATASESPAAPRGFWRGRLLFPGLYAAYLAFGVADLLVTWVILHLSGSEMNPIAKRVIEGWDAPGIAAYKFVLAAVVIVICEIVGRRRYALGRALAGLAVCVTFAAAVFGATLLVLRLLVDRGDITLGALG
jgi:hypothetical protein